MQDKTGYRIYGAALAVLGTVGLATTASAAGKLNVIYSFCSQFGCPDGDQPYGGVTMLPSGHMLGTTGFGGRYNGGTVFSLKDKKGGAKVKTLKSICAGTPPDCQPDEGPSTTLVQDTAGNIYGTVYFGSSGNGAVFELNAKANNKYGVRYIHTFNGSDGAGPWELSYAGQSTGAPYDGKSPLYGTTLAGGTGGAGTVFSLTPNNGNWNLATLWNFCATDCNDGAYPRAGVTVDPSGNLFGTNSYGGATSAGTIFEVSNAHGQWSEKTVYTFCSVTNCTDGNGSFAGLTRDSSGNLYGTTYFGGDAGYGVVFKVGAKGKYSVLYSFCAQTNCSDGSEPLATITLDANGDIFGATSRGGDANFGVLFEIANGSYKRVHSFCSQTSCSDGGYPYGTLALDAKGRIYGTTQYGGAFGLGSVYRLTP